MTNSPEPLDIGAKVLDQLQQPIGGLWTCVKQHTSGSTCPGADDVAAAVASKRQTALPLQQP